MAILTGIVDFFTNNAPLLLLILAAILLLLIVLWAVTAVRRSNKWREKEFEYNRDNEMLKVRISELEKESTALHERETQLLSERDSILMDAHEKADDILQQTMDRIQKSEAQIRQNRIIASCCITDARRRISDLMIEVSKRLILEDGTLLDASEITPEAVALAESREKAAQADFERLTGAVEKPAKPAEPAPAPLAKDAFTPEEPAPETPAEPAPAAPAFDLSKPAEPEDAGDDGFDPVFPAINGAEKTPVDPEERFTIRPDVDTPEDEEAGAVHLTLDLPEKKSGQEDDAI